LKELNVSWNPIGENTLEVNATKMYETAAEAFADMLKVNKTLRTLKLAQCGITSEGICVIAQALYTNNTLEVLHIFENCLEEQVGAVAFADMLTVNRTLKELDIFKNRIGTAGAKAFASMLEVNTTLRTLKLSTSDEGACMIARALHANNTLEVLRLDGK
jgi:Ran GTPase-activating protein (RanGAP) involved in mRNA processing and transport